MNARCRAQGNGNRALALYLAWCAALLLAPMVARAQPAAGGWWNRLRVGGAIGGVGASRLVEDGNGVTVQQRVSPSIGLDAQLTVSPGLALGVGVRAARTALTVEGSGRHWSGGTAGQYDLALILSRELPGRFNAHVGAVGSLLVGPRDLVPFRRHSTGVLLWGSEIGFSRRLWASPLHAALDAELLRLATQSREDPPVNGGWIGRVRFGLRYAR